MDIANGPGVRVSIFMQGCCFNCKNCFNPETHDFNGGKEFNDETIERILTLAKPEHIAGLSILGGEPMHPNNREGIARLAKAFKERYPNKSVWIWSGFTFDKIADAEALKYADVLVDGLFVEEFKNPALKWRGSSNQRVIDLQKTIKSGKIILAVDDVPHGEFRSN